MRGLLCGVIGGLVAAGVWLAAEHFLETNLGWMVCLVGIVTGLCLHKASSATSSGFARGALAILITLGAISGGQVAYAAIMKATSSGAAPANVLQPSTQQAAKTDTEEDETRDTKPVPAIPEAEDRLGGFGQPNYTKTKLRNNLQKSDMLWLTVAALAAYLTGKGSGGEVVAEETPEGEVPPAPAPTDPNEQNAEG